jgi:zinc transporter, ZIP family
MSTSQTVLLGAIAGLTIFVGLPLGRVRTRGRRGRAFLNAVSGGILVFLLFDILAHATDPVEEALTQAKSGDGGWGRFAGLGVVYVVGFGVGLLALFYLGRMWGRGREPRASVGPGAMATAETASQLTTQTAALRAGMSIAAGIGLHNFSEGLTIGQAAHSGEISLAALLIIGFGLHNTTEGFGIVGPLAAAGVRGSWGWLALAGLIGGGPTFLGTIVGTSFDSLFVYVGCLTLAAGAILYVIGELLPAGRRLSWETTLWGLFVGVMLGVGTDLVVAVAGG